MLVLKLWPDRAVHACHQLLADLLAGLEFLAHTDDLLANRVLQLRLCAVDLRRHACSGNAAILGELRDQGLLSPLDLCFQLEGGASKI